MNAEEYTKLRDHYDALRVNGISHKDATVNIARMIAEISFCLKKTMTFISDNYEEYLKERKTTTRLRVMLMSHTCAKSGGAGH